MVPSIKPARLRPGDLIGLAAPSGPVTDASRIERGVRYLEGLGYRVLVGKNASAVHGFLAGTDEQRLEDLHAFFGNNEVKAIFCIRGGYGASRLLPKLDYDLIRRNPKFLTGFSDITALQLAFWKQCRLVTFHGPMAGVEMAKPIHPKTEEIFWRMACSGETNWTLELEEAHLINQNRNKATGCLLGGNLTLICNLLGTSYSPSFSKSLLFLEEVAEEPYRVDRLLTQLKNAKIVEKTSGLLLGHFSHCISKATPSFTTEQILQEFTADYPKPALSNILVGHIPNKITLPIGVRAQIDPNTCSLQFLESVVL